MKNRIRLSLAIAFSIMAVVFSSSQTTQVYAAGGQGSSGTANSSVNGCTEGHTLSTTLCDNGLGGFAWHIFKTKSEVYNAQKIYKAGRQYGPQYCLTKSDQATKVNCSVSSSLSGREYKQNLATICRKADYDYYVAFVAEGWHGRSSKGTALSRLKNVPTYWGPEAWDTPLSGKYKQHYNGSDKYNKLHDYDDLKAALKDGTNVDGWKITAGAAKVYCRKDDSNSFCKNVGSGDSIKKGTGFFCVKSVQMVTLTAKAKDEQGNVLHGGKAIDNDEVAAGGTAKVSHKDYDPEEYAFLKWEPNGQQTNTYSEAISADKTVWAIYRKVPSFKGSVTLKAMDNNTVLNDNSWKQEDSSENVDIECPAVGGCKVRFSHRMKRHNNLDYGKSNYSVNRTSNLTADGALDKKVTSGQLASGSFNALEATTVHTDTVLSIYPGMEVCETLSFQKKDPSYDDPNGSSMSFDTNGNGLVDVEVCARGMGYAQPDDPGPGDPDGPDVPESPNEPSKDPAYVNIKVRNESVDKYNIYRRYVYAKPGDIVRFRATYNPVLQYTYYLVPKRIAIECAPGVFTEEFGNGSQKLGALYNSKRSYCNRSDVLDWNNSFSLQMARNKNFNSSIWTQNRYPANPVLGSTQKQQTENVYNKDIGGVLATDVGKTIDEMVITNLNGDSRTTMSQVSFGCGKLADTGESSYTELLNNIDQYEVEKEDVELVPVLDEEGNPVLDEEGNPVMEEKPVFYTVIEEQAYEEENSTETVDPTAACEENSDMVGTLSTLQRFNFASVNVPYNFNTQIDTPVPTTTDESGNPVFFAGEENKVTFDLTLKPRHNTTTMNDGDKDYATKVDGSKYKIIVYTGGSKPGTDWSGDDLCSYYGLPNNEVNCGYSAEVNGEFSSGVKQFEDTKVNRSRTFYAQDLNAGQKICVAAAFYPANSGSDTNMNSKGSDTWRISPSACYNIAKRPSIQVWGGDIFTKGGITTGTSIKNYLAGRDTYKVGTRNTNNYIFGSWGELGVLASGRVTGFASGASLGYESINASNGVLTPHPLATQIASMGPNTDVSKLGGRIESYSQTTFCNRVKLTFANDPCYSTYSGTVGNTSGADKSARDKESIIQKLIGDKEVNVGSSVGIADGMREYSYSGNSDLTVSGGIVSRGTYMIHSDKTVKIAGNIVYGGGYTTLTSNDPAAGKVAVPKVVIYGKNVVIDCGVTQVDALLVADEEVKTCDSDDINSKRNSNQLVLNGAVVAGWLTPNRTYGAATGANSIVPAEIIKFDPTLYLWGGDDGNDEDDLMDIGDLDVTYVQEISTRR